MSDKVMSDGTFNRLFIVMILSMVILTVIIMVLASVASSDVNERLAEQNAAESSNSIAERIAPVGKFAANTVANTLISTAQAEELNGEQVYQANCTACHAAGIAGAPALGDKSAWTERVAQGNDVLYEHAINGYQGDAGYMPAKGGNAGLTDDAVKLAVDHMLEQSK